MYSVKKIPLLDFSIQRLWGKVLKICCLKALAWWVHFQGMRTHGNCIKMRVTLFFTLQKLKLDTFPSLGGLFVTHSYMWFTGYIWSFIPAFLL